MHMRMHMRTTDAVAGLGPRSGVRVETVLKSLVVCGVA